VKGSQNAAITVIAIAAFFGLWEIAARNGFVDAQFVPPVSVVFAEMRGMHEAGFLVGHILASLLRFFEGLGLALVVGIPLGYLLGGFSPRFSAFIRPLFTNLSLLNPLALIPVFIVLFGIGETSKVAIIFWVLVFPVIFSTAAGTAAIDPARISVARSMGTKGLRMFTSVVLPSAVSRIFTGIKSSVMIGFIVLISAEMVGANEGLGFLVHYSQKNYNIPRLYVSIVLVAAIGFLLSVFIERLHAAIVVWKEEAPE